MSLRAMLLLTIVLTAFAACHAVVAFNLPSPGRASSASAWSLAGD